MSHVIPPGSALGVLGSGQLGRMFAIAARRMGYRVHTFSPDNDTPTGQVADREITAPYEDLDAIKRFARDVSVITFEFENVPGETAAAAGEFAPVRPNWSVLATTQNRLREKTFLKENGFPVTPFAAVRTADELQAAVELLGMPGVLKTAGWGYDGKGQAKVNTLAEVQAAWERMQRQEAILEQFIPFEREVSVIAARGVLGETADWGVVDNRHVNHILDLTIAPADVPEKTALEAREIAHEVLKKLDVVGVLCVEFFLAQDGTLMINELAPRPHNSGHFTFDACITSQFEQQVRAICGLPLGSTELLRPAAMVNLLGEIWEGGEPRWEAALAFPQVKLHLYGKASPRPGRKMGHLTAFGETPEEAAKIALVAREALKR